MSGSTQCPHSDLHFALNHVHLADCNVHYLEIKATCRICCKTMHFRGCPFGLSPERPTMAADGSEITIPFLAEGEEPSGNLIGFVGRVIA